MSFVESPGFSRGEVQKTVSYRVGMLSLNALRAALVSINGIEDIEKILQMAEHYEKLPEFQSGRGTEELRDAQYKKQKDKIAGWPTVKCTICGISFAAENGINNDFAIVKYFCLVVGPELVGMVCDSCGNKIESGSKLQFAEALKEAEAGGTL